MQRCHAAHLTTSPIFTPTILNYLHASPQNIHAATRPIHHSFKYTNSQILTLSELQHTTLFYLPLWLSSTQSCETKNVWSIKTNEPKVPRGCPDFTAGGEVLDRSDNWCYTVILVRVNLNRDCDSTDHGNPSSSPILSYSSSSWDSHIPGCNRFHILWWVWRGGDNSTVVAI